MLDEEDAHPPLVGEPADELGELAALVLVEAGGRLVEQQDRRAGGDRPGDADEPAAAVGQLVGGSARSSRSSNSWIAAIAAGGQRLAAGPERGR